MDVVEIIVIVIASLIVFSFFAVTIYRRIKGLPSLNDECASEHRGKALVAAYRKAKKKEEKKAEKAKNQQQNPSK